MSDYISREEVYQKLHEAGGCGATDEWSKGYDEAIGVAIGIIENAPAADVAPVIHAHWEKVVSRYCYHYECSHCGEEIRYNKWGDESFSARCPSCGTEMDEEEENEPTDR